MYVNNSLFADETTIINKVSWRDITESSDAILQSILFSLKVHEIAMKLKEIAYVYT